MNSIMASGSKAVQRMGGLAPVSKKRDMPFRQGPPMRDKIRKVETNNLGYPVAITPGNGTTSNDSQEELYRLCPNSDTASRPFCMIVRLTPEILDELKQAEADRTTPMMKFGDSTNAHVIRVGDESFKFSSAPEPGDLCDIFEERITESQQKFLTETGSAWRKLSVLRTLSASEKDRLKSRTEEAEKKQKSRKSILVDPNTQIILPHTTATEVAARSSVAKLRNEPPSKTLKVAGSPVAVGSIANLPHSNATSLTVGHQIDLHSSLSSEPINVPKGITQAGTSVLPKDHAAFGNSTIKEVPVPKENIPNTSIHSGGEDGRTKSRTNTAELRNSLITLLQENPKGMTIKAIEKAVSEGMTVHPDRKLIEKLIKSIASYHAPGKYLLKSGVEKENIVEMSSRAGDISSCTKVTEERPPSDILKIEIRKEKDQEEMQSIAPHHSETLSEKAVSPQIVVSETQELKENQEDSLGISNPKSASSDEDSDSSSSSGSGTESDSESGSSESGSASSSDSDSSSESDASSSSSEMCMDEDVDVDIMDDDEDNKKTESNQEKSRVEDGDVQESGPGKFKFQQKDQMLTIEHGGTSVKDTGDDFAASTHQNEFFQLESAKINQLKHTTDMMALDKDKCVSSEKLETNSVPTESNDGHQNSTLVAVDTQEEKTIDSDHLSILIDKICEYNSEGKSEGVTNKKLSHSPRSLSSIDIKDSESQRLHFHRRANEPLNLEKKEQAGDNSLERSLQPNLASKGVPPKTTMVKAKGRPKGMEKSTNESNKLKQVNPKKLSRSGSKRTDCTENSVRKTEVTDITEQSHLPAVKDKNPETVMNLSLPVGNIRGLHTVRSSDHDSCKKEDDQVKENVSQSNCKSRSNKVMGRQPFDQRDGSGINISSHTHAKDTEELVTSHQVGLLVKAPTKDRGKNAEFLKRVKPVEQQSENILKATDISSKFIGRALPNGGYSKDGQSLDITNSGSGLSSHREDDIHRVPLGDSELGEFREPFSGNECSEHSRRSSRSEKINSKAASEGRMSLSIRKSQSVSLSSSEISKQSSAPIDAFENNDSQPRYELVGTSKLPKKRLASNEPRQSNNVLVKDQREKKRSSTFDVRELGTDKIKYEECNKVASSKVSSITQRRSSSLPVKKHKNLTPEIMSMHASGRVKKHTPQSSEVLGSDFFAPYEKEQPELRGPINDPEQFKEYQKEFKEKYPIYVRLNQTIEINKEEFAVYWNNIEQAKFGGDKDKLARIYTEVRKEYLHCHKRYKRIRRIFNILHEELRVIKRRCQEYHAQITKT